MKRYSLAGFSLAIALMIILQASAPTRAQQIYSRPYTPVVGFDFEDGTVQGWQILYNGVNGRASLSNSTQQAYHGSHALALATTDYNFGGSYALIGVGNTVISPSLTAHLYMVSNDEPEPHPGIVTACFVITDSANRAYSGNQITLPFRQWMTLTASRPLTFTAPYILAVGFSYYNARPTVRTIWLDYIQWDDQPAATPTLPPSNTPTPTYTGTPPTVTPTLTATPSPTCSPNVCGPLNPTLAVGTVTTSSISLHATANFDIGTFSFYRSTTGGPFVYVGSAFGHYGEFTDTGLDCATTYSYYAHVQEYGGYQRQGDSNIVTATTASCAGTPIATNTFAPSSTPTNTPNPTYTPTTTVTTTPTDCPNPFVDISGNVFYIAIHYLNCRGVISGSNPTHYSPAGTATRGQFAKIVVLGFGLQLYTPTGGTQDFTDVPSSYFAYTYIETGLYYGVLSGFDQPNCAAHNAQYPCYLPNIPITRGQLTKLVVNAAHYPLYTPTNGQTFSDVPPTNVFYASIETAAHKGVIAGYPDGTFHPNNDIRRDEMAQIVYKGVTTP